MHSEGGTALKEQVIFSAPKARCSKKEKKSYEIETNMNGLSGEQDV